MEKQISTTNLMLRAPEWVRQAVAFAGLDIALLMDQRVPILAKIFLVASLIYWASPVDFIMGIPVIDVLDDLAVLGIGHGIFFLFCPEKVVQAHSRRIRRRVGLL